MINVKWQEFYGGKCIATNLVYQHMIDEINKTIDSANRSVDFDNAITEALGNVLPDSVTKMKGKRYNHAEVRSVGDLYIIIVREGKNIKDGNCKTHYASINKKTFAVACDAAICDFYKSMQFNACKSYMSYSMQRSSKIYDLTGTENIFNFYIDFLNNMRSIFPNMFDDSSAEYIGIYYPNDLLLVEYLKYIKQFGECPVSKANIILENWIKALRNYEDNGTDIDYTGATVSRIAAATYTQETKTDVYDTIDIAVIKTRTMDMISNYDVVIIDDEEKGIFDIFLLRKNKDFDCNEAITWQLREVLKSKGIDMRIYS